MLGRMDVIAFARGVPAPDMIPVNSIREAADRVLDRDGARVLSYGTGGGYPPLRELLAERHGVAPEQVIVTTGSLQGFAFLIQVLARRSADRPLRVAVENPTYDRPLLILRDRGALVDSLPLDQDGLDVDALSTLEPGTLLYTIPNFQNPAGATMTDDRRARLLEVARERDLLVLEDDPYGQLWFEDPPPQGLHERDDSVLYASSFSKTVSPGLRVGYMIAPRDLAADLERTANDTYISANLLGQAIVHDLLERDLVTPGIERCRRLLAERCDAMTAALDEHMPDFEYTRPAGGYFLWGKLPMGTSADDLLLPASEQGVSFVPGSAFGPGQEQALRLAFSFPTPDEVQEGVRRLGNALERSEARA